MRNPLTRRRGPETLMLTEVVVKIQRKKKKLLLSINKKKTYLKRKKSRSLTPGKILLRR